MSLAYLSYIDLYVLGSYIPSLYGIHYDIQTDNLYICDKNNKGIHLYLCSNDISFTYKKTYDTLLNPIFITLISNRMYVGTFNNSIVIYNQTTTNTPTTIATYSNLCPLSGQPIYSVAIDALNNLIYPCYDNYTVHLNYRNGTVYTLKTIGKPGYAFFDSKGRFIIQNDYPTALFFYY